MIAFLLSTSSKHILQYLLHADKLFVQVVVKTGLVTSNVLLRSISERRFHPEQVVVEVFTHLRMGQFPC